MTSAAQTPPEDAESPVGHATVLMPDGRSFELPVLKDAAGATFLDIRRLLPVQGICAYDPGFNSTASCRSRITYTDGASGTLLYRGYPIEDVAERGDFVEAAHLLLFGELPDEGQRGGFEREVKRHTLLHEQLISFYKGFKHDAHPMAIMVGVVGALSAFYHKDVNLRAPYERTKAAVRIIAKVSTMAAIAYKTSIGHPIIYPRNNMSYTENLLHMMFAVPCEPYSPDPVLVKALDVALILQMDHEQNASTSTVRTAGSSQANPFACIASGIAALWGPAHGGANEAVLNMLLDIGSPEGVPAALARAKDRSDPFRLMGFGHRVYKTYDPRARLMRKMCHRVLEHLGVDDDPCLQVALALEKAAAQDEYFVSRGLYPNVDFYSGIMYRAMGIPTCMFTVLFAVARTVGWMAQWMEMSSDPVPRIARPRQMYIGEMRRDYVPREERSGRCGGKGP
eukprot:evm.model.scf_1095EXC.3 EVM.evm.TU.scf_1095EXC.3   scf_1095EXC:45595-48729(+)